MMDNSAQGTGERGPARGAQRDSLFLLTTITSPEGVALGKARIRNLSATGLMADSELRFRVGQRVRIELRGLGIVEGSIAWAREERIGIAFDQRVDPQQARRPLAYSQQRLPDYLRLSQIARRR
jgi:hypothetical protein